LLGVTQINDVLGEIVGRPVTSKFALPLKADIGSLEIDVR